MTPTNIALIRLVSASLVLLILFCFVNNKRKPRIIDVLGFLATGICGFSIYNWGFNMGAVTTPASIVSFIIALSPVVVAIIARIFLGEKITKLGGLGLAISLVGLILILFSQKFHGSFNVGLLYAVYALLGFSLGTVLQKYYVNRFHPIEIATYSICFGTLILSFSLPNAIHQFVQLPLHYELILIYIGIFPVAIATILWIFLMKKMTATQGSTLTLLSPFVILVLAWLLLHELPAIWALAGGLIAILGTYLVIRFGHRAN
jgi:drug/metabolite transporter (DMT)-like permease